MAKLRILYGEGDEQVLTEQAAALEKAGHSVEKSLGRKAAEEALKKSKFDLIVLGATLTRNDRHHLPYMAKKVNAEIGVLVLHADGTRHPYVDACVDTGSDMAHILSRIETMKIAGMMPAVGKTAASAKSAAAGR